MNNFSNEIIKSLNSKQSIFLINNDAYQVVMNNKDAFDNALKNKGITQQLFLSPIETFMLCGHKKNFADRNKNHDIRACIVNDAEDPNELLVQFQKMLKTL